MPAPHAFDPSEPGTVIQTVPPAAPEPDRRPGGYEVVRELARGGQGRVVVARDLGLDREVALKLLLPGRADEAARRFVREARITARLQHPSIPAVHAMGVLPDGGPFLAMKLIRGRTLAELLHAEPPPELPRRVSIFEQVCQAVAYAHAQGVIHRDLKPANVMVGAFGEVQVMDWGLAKRVGEADDPYPAGGPPDPGAGPDGALETRAGTVMGTPAYMPPEQVWGHVDRHGPPADVFALGAILCHLLTGAPPYTGATTVEVLRKAARASLADAMARLQRCGAGAELIGLAIDCLASDPGGRPADAAAVAARVTAYRAGDVRREQEAAVARARGEEEVRRAAVQAQADRAGAEARAERRLRRRFTAAAALAGGLFLALVAGGGAWGYREWTAAARHARAAVPAQLQLAADLRKQYRFREAGEVLDHAARVAGAGGTPELARQAEQARADLDLVVKLDAIRMRAVGLITPTGAADRVTFDTASAPPAYRDAFAAAGCDVLAGDPAEVGAKVAASAVRAELVGALDHWAVHEPDAKAAERVLAVARAADPGPWLDRFRDPKVRAAPGQLARLFKDADPQALAPATLFALVELARTLGAAVDGHNAGRAARKEEPFPEAGELVAAAAKFLPAARLHHPADFLLAFTAGDYDAAHALRPDHPMALLGRGGLVSRDARDAEAAIGYYREAVRLDPNSYLGHYLLAGALEGKGGAAAVAEYKEAVRLAPKVALLRVALGRAQGKHGDRPGALASLREAVAADPTVWDAHKALAETLDAGGDRAGAVQALKAPAAQKALADDRDRYELAQLLEKLGDRTGAAAECARLFAGGRTAVFGCYLRLLVEDGNGAEAEKVVRDVLDRADRGFEAVTRAWQREFGADDRRPDPDGPVYPAGLGLILRVAAEFYGPRQPDAARHLLPEALRALESADRRLPLPAEPPRPPALRRLIDAELKKVRALQDQYRK